MDERMSKIFQKSVKGMQGALQSLVEETNKNDMIQSLVEETNKNEYIVENKVIKEYLEIDEKFENINEFVNYLNCNKNNENIKVNLKKMLVEKTIKNNESEVQQVENREIGENIAWILENCNFEPKLEVDNIELDNFENNILIYDFEKIKLEYEENDFKKVIPLSDEELDYTENIVLHEGGTISLQKKYQLYLSKSMFEKEIDLSKVLIVENEGNRVLALGYLVLSKELNFTYNIIFENKKNIDYNAFDGINRAKFIIYTKKGEIFSRNFEMDYKPFRVEKERPLCIDFGTSNTSVGSYGILDEKKDEAEVVKFVDVTVTPNNTEVFLLPTIVYVEDCSDNDNIKYIFGYEARKKIENERYESKASVYYEIKRWISSVEEIEEVRDSNNNKATPFRKDIIKAYIDYVIENAEQYFGTKFEKLHFSAPVKFKEQFVDVFSKLYYSEKHILSAEESIDEGIAIVYNQIITLMYSENSLENEERSIMIMDCGGGTTDLASCVYHYNKTDLGVELKLDTCFENGNSNFGGNNITYRIMQLLKIKIAAVLFNDIIDNDGEAINLIEKSENEILGLVESNMSLKRYDSDSANKEIYSKFLDNYNRAEDVIPTLYTGNKKYRGTESLKKIKRNFNYLWRQAEQIKIEFYKTERVLMNFNDIDENAIISITNPSNYYLYVSENNELSKIKNPFDKISITIKEINRVISGDIYSLLVGLFQNGELTSRKINVEDFNYYKLSGQSCKISLFSELIKEYIPGRKFRPAIQKVEGSKKRKSEDLKLDCILGCINYVKDQIRPEMNVLLKPNLPEIIYSIELKGNHNGNNKVFDCDDIQSIKMEISHKNTREYPFVVVGKDGILEREFVFKLRNQNEGDLKDDECTTKDIKEKILRTCSSLLTEESVDLFIQDITKLVSGKTETINIVFAIPAKHGYGVYIGQIQGTGTLNGNKYIMLNYEYNNFEDSSKTFFDGCR